MERITLTLLFVGFILISSVGVVHAQSSPEITCNGKTTEVPVAQATELYNNNTDAVPDIIRSAVASNTTELQISNASQEYYTVNTNDDLKITDVTVGEASNPDVIVQTDRDTACALYTSEEPVTTFEQAYADGEIEIEANGFVDSAKVYVVDKVVKALNIL